MTIQTPFAFLLVKFQGSNEEPITKSDAQLMFTAAGRGTMNVVDWFDDNTHGHVDMTGSAVFGWLELAETIDDYRAKKKNGTYSRGKIIDLGRDAAAKAGINLSNFTVVVVVTNLDVDLFGVTGSVCCTAATTNMQFWEIRAAPSVLCQEMIHGLGIYNHARRHGSNIDYNDPYDVMSMFRAWPGRHPNYAGLPIGPGLNAAFMQRCGWLDVTRAAPIGQIGLRPLHRRDLPGPLYAMVGEYYIEYRPSRWWDTGFSSVVLVHYISDDTSYLVKELRTGEEFSWGNALWIFESHGSIRVDDIDDVAEMATITTSYRPAHPTPVAGSTWSLSQSEFADGSGLVILGRKIIRIPPRSPELGLIEAAASLVSINDTQLSPALKTAARVDIYSQLTGKISEVHKHLSSVNSPLDHITMEEFRHFHRLKAAKYPFEPARI